MSKQTSDPDATTSEISAEGSPPSLVTDTGTHPVVVIKPEPRSRFIAGLALDITIVLCITALILFDKITASEGLPWIALLAGVKANQFRRPGLGNAGAVLTILGITKGIS